MAAMEKGRYTALCRGRRAGFLVLRTRHLVSFANHSIDGMELRLQDRLAAMRGNPTSVEAIWKLDFSPWTSHRVAGRAKKRAE